MCRRAVAAEVWCDHRKTSSDSDERGRKSGIRDGDIAAGQGLDHGGAGLKPSDFGAQALTLEEIDSADVGGNEGVDWYRTNHEFRRYLCRGRETQHSPRYGDCEEGQRSPCNAIECGATGQAVHAWLPWQTVQIGLGRFGRSMRPPCRPDPFGHCEPCAVAALSTGSRPVPPPSWQVRQRNTTEKCYDSATRNLWSVPTSGIRVSGRKWQTDPRNRGETDA